MLSNMALAKSRTASPASRTTLCCIKWSSSTTSPAVGLWPSLPTILSKRLLRMCFPWYWTPLCQSRSRSTFQLKLLKRSTSRCSESVKVSLRVAVSRTLNRHNKCSLQLWSVLPKVSQKENSYSIGLTLVTSLARLVKSWDNWLLSKSTLLLWRCTFHSRSALQTSRLPWQSSARPSPICSLIPNTTAKLLFLTKIASARSGTDFSIPHMITNRYSTTKAFVMAFGSTNISTYLLALRMTSLRELSKLLSKRQGTYLSTFTMALAQTSILQMPTLSASKISWSSSKTKHLENLPTD